MNNTNLLQTLLPYLNKPALYTGNTKRFWDDPHIASQMLRAHLDPGTEAASRNPAFLDRSAAWIASQLPQGAGVLDLGCGPGLYCSRLAARGFAVTGVDISESSLQYARSTAAAENLKITYLRQNYLDLDAAQSYDAVILIYCDYAVLPDADRTSLLHKIHRALNPGGFLLFDVFTPRNSENRMEETSWETCPDGGFWSAGPYVCLNAFYRYPNRVLCSHYVILTNGSVDCINVWDKEFTADELAAETTAAGFRSYECFNDVSGTPYSANSKTLCIKLIK